MKYKEYFQIVKKTFGILKWVFSIYYKISPKYTVLLVGGRIIHRSTNLLNSYLFALLIDGAVKAAGNPSEIVSYLLFPSIGLLSAHILIDTVIFNVTANAENAVRRLGRTGTRTLFVKKLQELGIQTLEDPDVENLIDRSSSWLSESFTLLNEGIDLLVSLARVIVSAVIIIAIVPYLVPVLIIIAIAGYIPQVKYNREDFNWQSDNSELRRKIWGVISDLQAPNSLQEITIVGGFKFLLQKYTKAENYYNEGYLKIKRKGYVVRIVHGTIMSALRMGMYLYSLREFILGRISIGTATFHIRAYEDFVTSLSNLLVTVGFMYDFALKIGDVVQLFEMEPAVKDGETYIPHLKEPPRIEFKNVWFRYPNSKVWVFKNLNLTIESGQEIAIVGHNGAGKTTLVKLLARFYKVTKGEILINGTNINDLQIDDWYKNIGILFQEYNFYGYLTAKENIGIGRPLERINMKRVQEAAINADSHTFIKKYQKKYNQIMSELYEGGIRPSTGQKQKISIARFFYRNAPLVIFDEPTASIDAVSEYKIFNRIYNFFNNKTVIIISHRFSTVRNADKIFVMEHGEVIEEGTHNQLMKLNKTYAKAFKLQAKGYNDNV